MTIIRDGLRSADLDFPVTSPTLNLDFTNEVLDKRITFTRGSSATRVNKFGLIETVSENQPRFDYDPITGECKGLLIEESRQNLLTYSEDLSNAVWDISGTGTKKTNTWVSPDGTLSGDTYTIGNNSAVPSQSVTVSSSTTYILSFYFNKLLTTAAYIRLRFTLNTGSVSAWFNVNTLKFETYSPGVSNGSLVNMGNNIYRISVQITYGSSDGGIRNVAIAGVQTDNAGIADTGKDITIWGAQLEAGAFPTSYIPTVASTVTRSFDFPIITGTNFTSWYNQSEGTVVSSSKKYNNYVDFSRLWSLSDGTNNNVLSVFYTDSSNFSVSRLVGGSSFFYTGTTAYTNLDKIGVTYNSSKLTSISNGKTPTQNNIFGTVTPNAFYIGLDYYGGFFNGAISRLTYYPKSLPPNQLQLLTV